MKHALLLLVFAVLPFLSGCGKPVDKRPTGLVSGTVTFKGKPVESGSVVFMSVDKRDVSSGTLDASGKYSLTRPLPIGKYNVAVAPPEPEGPQDPEKPVKPGPWYPIPVDQQTPDSGALTFEVKQDENTADFAL